MIFDEALLTQVAKKGSEKVSTALSILANTPVEVSVSNIETVPITDTLERIKPGVDHAIIVYAQVTTGVAGVAIMMMSREDALNLVDILARQPVGSTGILKDIDRSAIKEMLNILSNAYVTVMSESSKVEFELGVPMMVTYDRLSEIVKTLKINEKVEESSSVIFETILKVAPYKIKTILYFIFDEELVQIIKREEVVNT